jgi:hypothetical protein
LLPEPILPKEDEKDKKKDIKDVKKDKKSENKAINIVKDTPKKSLLSIFK